MDFIKLGRQPGEAGINAIETVYLNMEHVARVEFTVDSGRAKATVTTTKSGGSDRSFYYSEDAEKIREYIEKSMIKVEPPIKPKKSVK